MYTIEFQKRGLPHAHILLFLSSECKFPTGSDIDRIISAELPNPEANPALYEAVTNFTIHGPCGVANPKSPCMIDRKCSKHFPKKFVNKTSVDEDGYPLYRHRDSGIYVDKIVFRLTIGLLYHTILIYY